MKKDIVCGIGFGDEGKGLTVANLVTPKSLVVRFSGGQQCGHTVIHNGIKHVFSNYGSGTIRGCPTWFTEDTTFYLNTIAIEKKILNEKGITPTLFIHPHANASTPYDIIANRISEISLQHGSCGLGIGKTMKRNLETPYKLFAIDLFAPRQFLLQKLKSIEQYYINIFGRDTWKYYSESHSLDIESFLENLNRELFQIRTYQKLDVSHNYNEIIFEGSQGILLDMDHGIFPNVTFANTTSKNAWKYIGDRDIVNIYYVSRCYQTRHGNGWMSNNTSLATNEHREYRDISLINTEEEINTFNKYQENFRICEIDYDLINHAIEVDQTYHKVRRSSRTTNNFIMSCMDQRPHFIPEYVKIKGIDQFYENGSSKTGNIKRISLDKRRPITDSITDEN